MVRINKIYTRSGDDGLTGLVDGSRVPKESARVTSYGEIDELNSHLGVIAVFVRESGNSELLAKLEKIQNQLFDIGAQLATPPGFNQYPIFKVKDSHIKELENWIDLACETLPALTSFLLPGGNRVSAFLHVARTVCRRAERSLWALSRAEPVETLTIIYLNRLSDLFFALSRAELHRANLPEPLWVPEKKRL